jgi:hypothetical protein
MGQHRTNKMHQRKKAAMATSLGNLTASATHYHTYAKFPLLTYNYDRVG